MNESFFSQGALVSTQRGQVVIGRGRKEKLPFPNRERNPIFYFPDFFLDDHDPWFLYEECEELSVDQLASYLPASVGSERLHWSIRGLDIYSENFSFLKTAFKKGELKKAVPYLFYTANQSFELKRSLSHLLLQSKQHPTFLYGFWDEEGGMLGGTPEELFQITPDGVLTTAAVAGTVKHDNEDQLINDPKLKIEHDLVIEGILQSLSSFGAVDVGKTEILRLSHFSHAKTPIRVQLNSGECIDAITRALHPTPALGAFPKKNGSKWLTDYASRQPRGRYGAPVGLKIRDHFYCYVAIRNIQWTTDSACLGVGGGVVQASNEQDEKEELALKFEATRTMLNV